MSLFYKKMVKAFLVTHIKYYTTKKLQCTFFDILESRKANYLKKYFFRFPRKQRLAVKFGSIINNVGEKFCLTIFIYKKLSHIKDL